MAPHLLIDDTANGVLEKTGALFGSGAPHVNETRCFGIRA